MTINEFFDKAITKFECNNIDALFCFIQNDKELMKDYLDLVAESRDLGKVNRGIARQVALRYHTKAIQRDYQPNSTLIQSFSLLED